jgi:hypothetical protein
MGLSRPRRKRQTEERLRERERGDDSSDLELPEVCPNPSLTKSKINLRSIATSP